MLALFSIICIYGALASLTNSIFSQRILPMGPPLIKVTNKKMYFLCIPLLIPQWFIVSFFRKTNSPCLVSGGSKARVCSSVSVSCI